MTDLGRVRAPAGGQRRHHRRVRRRAPRAPGGHRRGAARWPPSSGARSAVVTFDRHPADGRATRVGAAACSPTSTRSSSCSAATGVDIDGGRPLRRGARPRVARGLRAARSSSGASAPGPWWSARTSTSATSAGATSPLLRRARRARPASRSLPLPLVPRVDGVDEPVSSTAIRRALAGGEVDVAARLLGRPFEARGIVVDGDQRGRLLGFPTANVEVPEPGLPARPTACTPAGTSGPTASCTRAPSTSVAGRRSTSTPTTRCSRPTCSTSRATSTASGPRSASRVPAQRAQVRRRRRARRAAQARHRSHPPRTGADRRRPAGKPAVPPATRQASGAGKRQRRGARGRERAAPADQRPDHLAVGAVGVGGDRDVVGAVVVDGCGGEHAGGRVGVDLGLEQRGIDDADRQLALAVHHELRLDLPAEASRPRRTGSSCCRRP